MYKVQLVMRSVHTKRSGRPFLIGDWRLLLGPLPKKANRQSAIANRQSSKGDLEDDKVNLPSYFSR